VRRKGPPGKAGLGGIREERGGGLQGRAGAGLGRRGAARREEKAKKRKAKKKVPKRQKEKVLDCNDSDDERSIIEIGKPKKKPPKLKKAKAHDDSDDDRSIIEMKKPGVRVAGVLPSPEDVNELAPPPQSRENIELMRKRLKRKKKRSRKPKKDFEEDDDGAAKERERAIREQLMKLEPGKAASKPDASFYPPPKNLEKRRCYIHKNAKALKCTVCDGGDLLSVI
jgi:hypothetical protein